MFIRKSVGPRMEASVNEDLRLKCEEDQHDKPCQKP